MKTKMRNIDTTGEINSLAIILNEIRLCVCMKNWMAELLHPKIVATRVPAQKTQHPPHVSQNITQDRDGA